MVADSKMMYYDRPSELLRAIAHPVRLAIIDLLGRHPALSVTEIHEKLHIEQATASHHLKILRFNQVVDTNRKGRFTYYSLLYDDFQDILRILRRLEGQSPA